MAVANKFGLTARFMKATGAITKPTGAEDSSMRMVMCMKDSGKTTKHMGLESTLILTERLMKVSG